MRPLDADSELAWVQLDIAEIPEAYEARASSGCGCGCGCEDGLQASELAEVPRITIAWSQQISFVAGAHTLQRQAASLSGVPGELRAHAWVRRLAAPVSC